jgi:hypothetical protein
MAICKNRLEQLNAMCQIDFPFDLLIVIVKAKIMGSW